MMIEDRALGRIEVNTLTLPDDVTVLSGTYTYSGKVLITYKTENDLEINDFYNLAVLDDDGANFQTFFSGVIPTKAKANGTRYMPFQDNKRVLLGDYVLECSPDIDNCTSTKLIPIEYPTDFDKGDHITHRWSEVIIAPDNKHMSWTTLGVNNTAAAAIGTLVRQTGCYTLENVQLISSPNGFANDKSREGFMLPLPLRGGEVKQFVCGGTAISVVGAKHNSMTDSVVIDLSSEELTQITFTPGYDETTIFSPDERLGIVMSSRFSRQTDPAIFGLMPRPHGAHTFVDLPAFLYTYAVTGVRKSRTGNIGPVLIEIQRSMLETGYLGIQLTTDENWVYYSPMSWHPDGKGIMWPEGLRGSDGSIMRLQVAKLLDYQPSTPVPFSTTPVNISYGIKDFTTIMNPIEPMTEGKIAGRHSGYIHVLRKVSSTRSGETVTQYVNFSDDGENFYHGFEKVNYDFIRGCRYEANLELTGAMEGEMNFRATFSTLGGPKPAQLLFEPDEDGRPKSYGYASYNGVTLNIADLSE